MCTPYIALAYLNDVQQAGSIFAIGKHIGSQFSQLQGTKPANHIIDRELHLMSVLKRDVNQTFRFVFCTALHKLNTLMDDLLLTSLTDWV